MPYGRASHRFTRSRPSIYRRAAGGTFPRQVERHKFRVPLRALTLCPETAAHETELTTFDGPKDTIYSIDLRIDAG